jgi:4-hydroxyphenylacetate 3-monooxygenase
VKLMKLLWDAAGTELGGRHDLYERNYAGAPETVGLLTLQLAEATGRTRELRAFAEQCLAEYNLEGWTVPDLVSPRDVNLLLDRRRP